MGSIDWNRVNAFETRLGSRLPTDFLATLINQEPIREGSVALVAGDRIWDVRCTFGLEAGHNEDQLDRVYDLVGDVLPPGALPFAEDWGGNFYCIMLSGPYVGRVLYWNHERDAGDHRMESVARSVSEFHAALVPDRREAGA